MFFFSSLPFKKKSVQDESLAAGTSSMENRWAELLLLQAALCGIQPFIHQHHSGFWCANQENLITGSPAPMNGVGMEENSHGSRAAAVVP